MRDGERLNSKLLMRYYGPFQVLEVLNDVSYYLKVDDLQCFSCEYVDSFCG